MGYDFENIYKGSENFPIGLFKQNMYLPLMHHHQEYEILYIDSGNATVYIGEKIWKAKARDVFYIEPGTDHCVKDPSKNFIYYAIVFDTSVLGTDKDAARNSFDSMVINQRLFFTDLIFESIKNNTEILQKNSFGKEILIKNMIFQIFSHVINTNQYYPLPEFQVEAKGLNAINNGIQYIKDHYKDNISLEDLLNCTNYSKSHFIRLFKIHTGMNYTDYLNRVRIDKACRDLIYTNKNITEIATENGFNNIQYFSKIFKKYMSCTPKQYQKKSKEKNV